MDKKEKQHLLDFILWIAFYIILITKFKTIGILWADIIIWTVSVLFPLSQITIKYFKFINYKKEKDNDNKRNLDK